MSGAGTLKVLGPVWLHADAVAAVGSGDSRAMIVYKIRGEPSGVALEFVLTRRSSSEFGAGAAREPESPKAREAFGDGDRP